MGNRQALSFASWLLIGGLVALAVGLSMSGARFDGRVICDGQTMGPGDVCISTSSSNSGTYEERMRKDRESAESSAANGPLVALLGGIAAAGGLLVLLTQVPRSVANREQAPRSSDW